MIMFFSGPPCTQPDASSVPLNVRWKAATPKSSTRCGNSVFSDPGCIRNVSITFQELGRHIEQAHVRPAAVRNFLHLIPDLAYGKERALASIALLIVLMAVIYQLVLQPYPYNIGGRFFDL